MQTVRGRTDWRVVEVRRLSPPLIRFGELPKHDTAWLFQTALARWNHLRSHRRLAHTSLTVPLEKRYRSCRPSAIPRDASSVGVTGDAGTCTGGY